MKKEDKEKLQQLRKILFDMHTEHFNSDHDGHHKSQEGLIEITYIYPNWFEAEDYMNDEPEMMVSVYSYLFGPNRMHDFNSLDEAIEEVRSWRNP